MSRDLRYLPTGGALVEVTQRTIQGRFFLRPDRQVNEIVLGVLARAQSFCDVKLIGIVVLSNHVHMLLWAESQYHLSKLMHHFGGNCAREINRLTDWRGSMWERRYTGICVTTEPSAQIARLQYIILQTIKDQLVEKVEDWPGIHFGKQLLEGRELLTGKWIDRTKKRRLEAKSEKVKPKEYTETLTVKLHQLPCLSGLSWREYVRYVTKMIRDLEKQAAVERELRGIEVVGAAAVCGVEPQTRPNRVKESPAPRVHAGSKKERLAWREGFAFFVAAYREAAELLKKGFRDAPFPEGCFPPRLPFVGDTGRMAAAPG